jgi:cytidylate kinase
MTSPLVTISASYGAGGSRVAPDLAAELGVPYVERVMRRLVADRVAGPLTQAQSDQQPVGRSLGRLLRSLTASSPPVAGHGDQVADEEYRRAHEDELHGYVDSGAVILGRAAAVVLRDVPHALHVRLSGPAELRHQQAAEIEEIDLPTARWRQTTEDLARDAYVRHFYGLDPDDPALYHLTIDSTRLDLADCVRLLAAGATGLSR